LSALDPFSSVHGEKPRVRKVPHWESVNTGAFLGTDP
jgi:hypothetical protein